MSVRVGLLGGSFNPPHNGHLAMARMARDARNLDEVWFLVAARPAHKSKEQLENFNTRMEMTTLAAKELPFTKANDIENVLPGVSYTYRTLEVMRKNYMDTIFFFILGADTVPELATWKNPQKILKLTEPIVVPRTGYSVKDVDTLTEILRSEQIETLQKSYLTIEPVDISSTMIREKIRIGKNIDKFVPVKVVRYITQHGLYKSDD